MVSLRRKQWGGDVLEIGLMPQSVNEPAALVQLLDGRGFVDGGPKWTLIHDLAKETPEAA